MDWLGTIVLVGLIGLLVYGLILSLNSSYQIDQANAQANRDCVQMGYDGGEAAIDMPNALRCWTIILVDEKGQ